MIGHDTKRPPGRAHRLGMIPDANRVMFFALERQATAVERLLFDERDKLARAGDPAEAGGPQHAFLWPFYVKGARPGAHNAYRIDLPSISVWRGG